MKVVDKDLMAMKVDEVKVELEARDDVKTGNKAWLAAAAASNAARLCRNPPPLFESIVLSG